MQSFTPIKGRGGKSCSHCKGGGQRRFWGIFYSIALSFIHVEEGG